MPRLTPIPFHQTKYGPELLIDVASVHEMPTFITDAPHVLGFYDLILITRGRGTFALDGHRHPVRPGAVFFTAPGQIRDWHVEDLDGVCLFFPRRFLDEFFADPTFLERLPFFAPGTAAQPLYLSPRATARFRTRLATMRRELRSLRRDSGDLLRARLYEILITLARAYAKRPNMAAVEPNALVSRYRTLIDRYLTEHHDVSFYAAKLGVTPGHLTALCRTTTRSTAKTLLTETISLRARRLLLYSDRTAAEIAEALGFEDPSYFTRFMRRTTGRTPSTFRRQNGVR